VNAEAAARDSTGLLILESGDWTRQGSQPLNFATVSIRLDFIRSLRSFCKSPVEMPPVIPMTVQGLGICGLETKGAGLRKKRSSGAPPPQRNLMSFPSIKSNQKKPPRPPLQQLRHYCQRKIVAVAAGVAGFEIVAVHHHDRAVGQVAEGAGNRGRGAVLDHG
jgi:hypothetical protein